MNHVIAYELLSAELNAYRELSYQQLCQLIGDRTSRLIHGDDGADYDLTVVVQWRLNPAGDVRVTGSISEANWGGPHDTLEDIVIIPHPSGGHGIRGPAR
jgi:hypothetical protein